MRRKKQNTRPNNIGQTVIQFATTVYKETRVQVLNRYNTGSTQDANEIRNSRRLDPGDMKAHDYGEYLSLSRKITKATSRRTEERK